MSFIKKVSSSTLWSAINIDADKDMVTFGLENLKEICAGMVPGDIIAYDQATGRLAAVHASLTGTQLLTKGTTFPPVWGFPDSMDIGVSIFSPMAAGSDDSEGVGAVYNNASASLRFGKNVSDLKVGMRFRNINLPAGAIIYSAFIGFTCDSSRAAQTVTVSMRGEKSAAPLTYGAGENFTARTLTTAVKLWTPAPSWTVDAQYPSGALTSIVQELVNAYGAYVNGVMAFQIVNSGSASPNFQSAYSYDANPLKAPVLYIRYGVT